MQAPAAHQGQENLTKVPVVPSVHIIIRDNDSIRAVVGGTCPILASALKSVAEHFPKDVVHQTDVLTPVGQDIYEVTYDYLMKIRGLFIFMNPSEISNLDSTWPSTMKYSFVVTR